MELSKRGEITERSNLADSRVKPSVLRNLDQTQAKHPQIP